MGETEKNRERVKEMNEIVEKIEGMDRGLYEAALRGRRKMKRNRYRDIKGCLIDARGKMAEDHIKTVETEEGVTKWDEIAGGVACFLAKIFPKKKKIRREL